MVAPESIAITRGKLPTLAPDELELLEELELLLDDELLDELEFDDELELELEELLEELDDDELPDGV